MDAKSSFIPLSSENTGARGSIPCRFNIRSSSCMNKPRRRIFTHFCNSNVPSHVSGHQSPGIIQTSRHCKSNVSEKISHCIQDFELSGLRNAFDPKANCFRKLFWVFLWLGAVTCCVLGITNCIVAFASSPFVVNVIFKANKTLTAPHVTICPVDINFRTPAVSPILLKEHSCNTSYKNALELMKTCNMTIESIWNYSRFEMTEPLYHLFEASLQLNGFVFKSLKEIQKKEVTTIQGICLMFKMGVPFQCRGMQHGFNIKGLALTPNGTANAYYVFQIIFMQKQFQNKLIIECNCSYIKNKTRVFMIVDGLRKLISVKIVDQLTKEGIIHSEEEIPLIRYTGAAHKGFYAAYNHLTIVGLRVQQVIHINTWKNPCQSEANLQTCLLECIEKKIISESKLGSCRMPYMNEMLPLPLCTTEDELLDMYTATQSAVHNLNPEICGCIKSCNKFNYREDYFLPYPKNYLLGLYIAIPQCNIEVIEEELMYGFTSFLSDIGGNLGLYLGLSILSIIEMLEVLLLKSLSIIRGFSNNST